MKKLLLSLALVSFLGACQSVKYVSPGQVDVAPPAGKSAIVFKRHNPENKFRSSSLFDITDGEPRFLGLMRSNDIRIKFVAEPGIHKFAHVYTGQRYANILEANVSADRTYVVGIGRSSSSRYMQIKPASQLKELGMDSSACKSCYWGEPTEKANAWSVNNMHSIKARVEAGLIRFKSGEERNVVEPTDYLK